MRGVVFGAPAARLPRRSPKETARCVSASAAARPRRAPVPAGSRSRWRCRSRRYRWHRRSPACRSPGGPSARCRSRTRPSVSDRCPESWPPRCASPASRIFDGMWPRTCMPRSIGLKSALLARLQQLVEILPGQRQQLLARLARHPALERQRLRRPAPVSRTALPGPTNCAPRPSRSWPSAWCG